MKEKTLLKVALLTSLVGILILLFILEKIDLSSSNIANITKDNLDEKIKIKAEVTKVTETPGLYILDVKDFTGSIKVVVFKDEPLEIKQGDILEIEGQVTSYKDQVEIIAKKITVL